MSDQFVNKKDFVTKLQGEMLWAKRTMDKIQKRRGDIPDTALDALKKYFSYNALTTENLICLSGKC